MNSFSKKIILIPLLTIFLWSGFGIFNSQYAFAQDTQQMYSGVNSDTQAISDLLNSDLLDETPSGVMINVPNNTSLDTSAVDTSGSGASYTPAQQNTNITGSNIGYQTDSSGQVIPGTQSINGQATESGTAGTEDSSGTSKNLGEALLGIITGNISKDISLISDYVIGSLAKPFITAYTFIIFVFTLLINALVFVFAAILDLITYLSIGKFKSVVDASGITLAWTIMRNLLNISFIFVLLYISITTILGSAGPKQKSTIAQVIIAALLINFSLFFTRIAIDAGNYVAVALFNQTGGTLGQATENIMNATKLSTVFNFDFTLTGQSSKLILMYSQMILGILLIWAFASAAFLFLGRMILLLFLMATSPIGFVGDAIPWLKEYSDQWKKTLFGQIMVAPIFFLFMVIINEFLKNYSKINTAVEGVWASKFTLGPIIYYTIIIGFLMVAVKATKKLSGEVGNMAVKMIKAAIAAIAIAVTGGTALAVGGLASTGALGASAAKNFGLKKMASSVGSFASGKMGDRPGMTGMAARFGRGLVMDKVKDATGGKVDLAKTEKSYDTYQKAEAKRIVDDADEKSKVKPEDIQNKKAELQNNITVTEQSLRDANTNLTNARTDQEKEDAMKLIQKLEKEKKKHEDLLALSNGDKNEQERFSAEIKKEKKEAILKKAIESAEKSKISKVVGLVTKKGKAKYIRDAMKNKSSDDLLREAAKKKSEEDKAAGITSEDEKIEKKDKKPEEPNPAEGDKPKTS